MSNGSTSAKEIAFLLLSHQRPLQLKRLIASLWGLPATFFLHVDGRCDLTQFTEVIQPSNRIRYIKRREKIIWGSFRMVEAELELLRVALSLGPFRYFVLLSGDSYPIVSNNRMQNLLSGNTEYIHLSMMTENSPFAKLDRISTYYVPARVRYTPWQNYANLILNKLPERNWRKGLGGLQAFGGPQWWALSRSCVEYILRFDKSNPRFRRTFFWSFVPDEMFFHTIVANSPFAANAKDDLMYTDWQRNPPPHPAHLKEADFPFLQESGKAFARKIDESVSPGICDLIDRELRHPPAIQHPNSVAG